MSQKYQGAAFLTRKYSQLDCLLAADRAAGEIPSVDFHFDLTGISDPEDLDDNVLVLFLVDNCTAEQRALFIDTLQEASPPGTRVVFTDYFAPGESTKTASNWPLSADNQTEVFLDNSRHKVYALSFIYDC